MIAKIWGKTRHGTLAGYNKHRAFGERPCGTCSAVRSEHMKRYRKAPEHKRRALLMARAQGRARGRLVAMFPEEYASLYEEAKAEVFKEMEQ